MLRWCIRCSNVRPALKYVPAVSAQRLTARGNEPVLVGPFSSIPWYNSDTQHTAAKCQLSVVNQRDPSTVPQDSKVVAPEDIDGNTSTSPSKDAIDISNYQVSQGSTGAEAYKDSLQKDDRDGDGHSKQGGKATFSATLADGSIVFHRYTYRDRFKWTLGIVNAFWQDFKKRTGTSEFKKYVEIHSRISPAQDCICLRVYEDPLEPSRTETFNCTVRLAQGKYRDYKGFAADRGYVHPRLEMKPSLSEHVGSINEHGLLTELFTTAELPSDSRHEDDAAMEATHLSDQIIQPARIDPIHRRYSASMADGTIVWQGNMELRDSFESKLDFLRDFWQEIKSSEDLLAFDDPHVDGLEVCSMQRGLGDAPTYVNVRVWQDVRLSSHPISSHVRFCRLVLSRSESGFVYSHSQIWKHEKGTINGSTRARERILEGLENHLGSFDWEGSFREETAPTIHPLREDLTWRPERLKNAVSDTSTGASSSRNLADRALVKLTTDVQITEPEAEQPTQPASPTSIELDQDSRRELHIEQEPARAGHEKTYFSASLSDGTIVWAAWPCDRKKFKIMLSVVNEYWKGEFATLDISSRGSDSQVRGVSLQGPFYRSGSPPVLCIYVWRDIRAGSPRMAIESNLRFKKNESPGDCTRAKYTVSPRFLGKFYGKQHKIVRRSRLHEALSNHIGIINEQGQIREGTPVQCYSEDWQHHLVLHRKSATENPDLSEEREQLKDSGQADSSEEASKLSLRDSNVETPSEEKKRRGKLWQPEASDPRKLSVSGLQDSIPATIQFAERLHTINALFDEEIDRASEQIPDGNQPAEKSASRYSSTPNSALQAVNRNEVDIAGLEKAISKLVKSLSGQPDGRSILVTLLKEWQTELHQRYPLLVQDDQSSEELGKNHQKVQAPKTTPSTAEQPTATTRLSKRPPSRIRRRLRDSPKEPSEDEFSILAL